MIHVIISSRPDLEFPLCIKVPSRPLNSQPYLGFVSKEIGEAFLKIRNIEDNSCYVAPVTDVLDKDSIANEILVFETEQQIIDSGIDTEGFDYESLIQKYAL